MEGVYGFYVTKTENEVSLLNDVKMTVCIACLADNGTSVVLAADNMTTRNISNGVAWEDENENNKKITKISNSIFILAAGGSASSEIIEKALISHSDTIEVATDKLKQSYQLVLQNMKLTTILIPNGFKTWDDYINNQNKLHPNIAGEIFNRLNTPFDNYFTVVAINTESNKIEIRTLYPNCAIDDCKFGVSIIGNGTPIATFSLMKSKYSPLMDLNTVKSIVIEAMEDASHSPGVGKLGELITLTTPL